MSDNNAMPPGTDTCGCCDGIVASTPVALFNRAGLDAIDYRIGDHARFRESLLAGLSSPDFAALADLRTRDADDYTLGLIDAVACTADVLTFYQERIANESYLRTATEALSLHEMGKLTGYRPRPGMAAETWLAFALETPRSAPATMPPEPGAFVTGIPDALTLTAGLKVQSVPGPNEKPQVFETVEDIAARPEWNAIRPWLSALRQPGAGATDTWLDGLRNNLKVGDALVFVDPAFFASPASNTNWNFRLIDRVEPDEANVRTHVTWKAPLTATSTDASPLQVHALRKRVGVFGHNAPMWKSMSRQFRHGYPGGTNADEWPEFKISDLPAHVDLEAVVPELRPDALVVLTRTGFNTAAIPVAKGSSIAAEVGASASAFISRQFTGLYKITSASELSLAAFALSGKVTQLGLGGQRLDPDFVDSVRGTSVYAQSERLTLAPGPVTDAVGGPTLPLAVSTNGLFAGRKIIVIGTTVEDGERTVHQATLTDVQPSAPGTRALLTISPPLPAPLLRDSVVVHANVALGTHGETVMQILGAGDAGRRFQRFELQRLPLTYRSSGSPEASGGVASELSVRVNDIEWTEKPTLFGTAATDRAYALNVDEHDRLWVVFGDGLHGARLPGGVNNVRARYRQGLGPEGNVRADQLTQLMTRPLGLKSVSNIAAAQGGTAPEASGQSRHTMPLGTRTLGRAVSLLDYEDFAMAFGGIAKAQAQVLRLAAGATIAVTVAGQDGAPLDSGNPIWRNLLLALKTSGDPHVSVVLLPYRNGVFHLGLKVRRDPAYELKPLLQAVENALRSHYGFDARTLGQPVLQSDVIAVVHSVPGVVAVDLDFLYGGTVPAAQAIRSRQTRLLAARMHVEGGVAMPAELLILAAGPLVRLEEMS
jgi:hypothetical protein